MEQRQVSITHGRDGRLENVANLNGRVFDNDPVIKYILLSWSQEKRTNYLPTYWAKLIKAAILNEAMITESGQWKAAAVLIPPGKHIENKWTLLPAGILGLLWRIGFSGFKHMFIEYPKLTSEAKQKGLRGHERYYYVLSIGTEKEHQGKGLAKAIIEEYQRTAATEKLPIWLEATTPKSRNLYLSMGFQIVEEIRIGKDKVNAVAEFQPGGPGIPLWAMIWWPSQSNTSITSL